MYSVVTFAGHDAITEKEDCYPTSSTHPLPKYFPLITSSKNLQTILKNAEGTSH
jgi:hypothetical protein